MKIEYITTNRDESEKIIQKFIVESKHKDKLFKEIDNFFKEITDDFIQKGCKNWKLGIGVDKGYDVEVFETVDNLKHNCYLVTVFCISPEASKEITVQHCIENGLVYKAQCAFPFDKDGKVYGFMRAFKDEDSYLKQSEEQAKQFISKIMG